MQGLLIRQLLPLSALMLSLGFLLFAGGITGLILRVRGEFKGLTALPLGLPGRI